MGEDMSSQLTGDEQEELDAINKELADLRPRLDAVRQEKKKLYDEKSALDNELEMNLYRQRDELAAVRSPSGVAS